MDSLVSTASQEDTAMAVIASQHPWPIWIRSSLRPAKHFFGSSIDNAIPETEHG